MKYVFGFNVGVELYKKFPTLQIYVKDRLIDEFELDEKDLLKHRDFKNYERLIKNTPQKKAGEWKNMEHITQFTLRSLKIRLYELDDAQLENSIKIIVKNTDSNYTNGFMTKSTTVVFPFVFLMPLHLFNSSSMKKLYKKQLDGIDCTDETKGGLADKIAQDKFGMTKMRYRRKHMIPAVERIAINSIEDNDWLVMQWPCTNTAIVDGKLVESIQFFQYGGNKTFEFPIVHKLKYKSLKTILNPDSKDPEHYMYANGVGLGSCHTMLSLSKLFVILSQIVFTKYK
ncbi:MAG: hypothetical protein CL857_05345 [Cryomorphaceae bacterium]|nr:hypothetical protein [Cryomorphaceae bacterium]